MDIEKPDIWEDRFCNECLRGQDDVKVLRIGQNCIALCKGCKEKLRILLNEEEN